MKSLKGKAQLIRLNGNGNLITNSNSIRLINLMQTSALSKSIMRMWEIPTQFSFRLAQLTRITSINELKKYSKLKILNRRHQTGCNKFHLINYSYSNYWNKPG